MKKSLFAIILLLLFLAGKAQVAINEDASDPDNSAMLDIKSTHMGLLIPRMNFSQMYNVEHPATGLLVFNTSAKTFYYYDGKGWMDISAHLENINIKVLNVSEILNIKAVNEPEEPRIGDLYMDIKSKKLRCWNGIVWKDLW